MNSKSNSTTDELEKILKRLEDSGKLVPRASQSGNILSKLKTIIEIVGLIPECLQKVFTVVNIKESFERTYRHSSFETE